MWYQHYFILFIPSFDILFLKENDINHNIIELIFLDIGNNKIKKMAVKHLFEQHTSNYSNIQEQILQLKKEKLDLTKEKFEFKKKAHQEHTKFLISIMEKLDELANIIRPQYLE